MKLALIMGTRPEIMKNYAIVRALRARNTPHVVLHTNQQRDSAMQHAHFAQAGYRPDAGMPPPYRFGRAVDWIGAQAAAHHADTILVNGDTAAALAGATAALYAGLRLVHVEAGLRAFDPYMIEERNRIAVDAMAHDLFTYTAAQRDYLLANRELRGRVLFVGNTTLDLLHDFCPRLPPAHAGRYVFVTLHRRELTEDAALLRGVLAALEQVAPWFDAVLLPLHPRTRAAIARAAYRPGRVTLMAPLPFLSALALERGAALIVTDSGCVQEEAYLFGVPCVTVRPNTERPETLVCGANVVAGYAPEAIVAAVEKQAARRLPALPPVYGEPGAGERIAAALLDTP